MPKKHFMKSCAIAVLALGVSTAPALAGFEWVSPQPAPQPIYQQPAPAMAPTSSLATGAPEVISPVIISGDTTPPPPVVSTPTYQPVSPYHPTPSYPSAVVSRAPSAPAASTVSASEPTSMAGATLTLPASAGGDVVQGFASQVPLALALRQILPIGYNFSIDQDVDMDTPVSYKGGKPWRDTLNDMLVPVGLVSHQQGAAVTVSRAGTFVPTPVALTPTPSLPTPVVVSEHVSDLPVVNVGTPDGWSAQRGDTLHKVLGDWCAREGVELQWQAEYDYPLEASAHFNGNFENAVRNLLDGFENARPQPVAELHTNANAGQKLLVVQARGNTDSN